MTTESTSPRTTTPDYGLPYDADNFRERAGLSPLHDRYWRNVEQLGAYFGEESLMRARVGIEARWLIALSDAGALKSADGAIRTITAGERSLLFNFHEQYSHDDYLATKAIEKTVRQDIAAMRTHMVTMLKDTTLSDIADRSVHWGLTSEDINNLAYGCLIERARKDVLLPKAGALLNVMADFAEEYADVTIPGKSHFKTAVPTTLGKEVALHALRMAEQFKQAHNLPIRGKVTGAVGNLNALYAARPDIKWRQVINDFVQSLGLEPNPYTTQIEPHDRIVEIFEHFKHSNNILVDACQDFRLWAGIDYLSLKVVAEEIGSSTMPQKVNPEDFERAGGNAKWSNGGYDVLARELPVSWLQRDLSDSTIQRNIGSVFGYQAVAIDNLHEGMTRISPNREYINEVLNQDWSIIAEGLQTILRDNGVEGAYNTLKKISRGKRLDSTDIANWINTLEVDDRIKDRLRAITPFNYIGDSVENAHEMVAEVRNIATVISTMPLAA